MVLIQVITKISLYIKTVCIISGTETQNDTELEVVFWLKEFRLVSKRPHYNLHIVDVSHLRIKF